MLPAIGLIFFIFTYKFSEKNFKLGLIFALFGFFSILFLIYHNPLPVIEFEKLSYSTLGFKTISLVHMCNSGLPFKLCKILYNKPTVYGSQLIERYISKYSQNYLQEFFPIPLFSFFLFAGLFEQLMNFLKSNRAKIFAIWFLLYGLTAIFNEKNMIYSVFFLFVFLALRGLIVVLNIIKQAYGYILQK